MTSIIIVAIVLVIVLAGGLIWYLFRGKKNAVPVAGNDVAFLAREAGQRLAASSRPSIARLPVVLVVGDPQASKTTIIVNSGLNPELLAGQDREMENGPVPATPCANFWLAGGTVLVEAGGPLLAQPGGVAGLAATVRAATSANLLGAAAQSPRALIVCVDAGQFCEPNAAATLAASAKRIRAIVGEVAQAWSARMPMYVLFTKMDRLRYFSDYVHNLSLDEAGRVFGYTLPLASSLQPGIYNQEQAARLNQAFDIVEESFIDSRTELLRRENEPARSLNTYEFPREFHKLRDEMVRFLVELGRPSQLQATPFLRGFFFTGARPVSMPGAQNPGQMASARRVPQWVFLAGFFRDALLGDKLAFEAATANTSAGRARNWLLGAAAAISLLWLTGATVSFFNNRAILAQAHQAAAMPMRPDSLESLRAVEALRLPAQAVSDHRKYGPPMSYRWGVYPGELMQDAVRETYCRALERSMLTESRQSLERRLSSLTFAPGPGDDYDTTYRELKAYLMLTSNPERADAGFLGTVLTARFTAARNLEPNSEFSKLTENQFRFLGSQRTSGFCGGRAQPAAIAQARVYLNRFPLVDRVYRSMIEEVNRQGPPIRFADATLAVSDPREVGYAFSKPGFDQMKAAMGKALDYLDREQWVLGKTQGEATPQGLLSELSSRYQRDFQAQWNNFIEGAAVNRYAGLKDAATKLASLASAESPLARLFCLVSVNTQVENAAISEPFKPFQGFAPPATCAKAPTGPSNQSYLQGLIGLQVGVDRIANAPNPDAERLTESDPAKAAAMTTAQQLNLGAKPAQLLKDPILFAEGLLKGVPAAAANGKGGGFCAELRPVLGKYPFAPGASSDAQPSDLAAVFAPGTGRLFTFPQEALSEFISPGMGGRFMAKSDARVPVNPSFLNFLNKGGSLSRLFYGAGPSIRVPFSLQVAPSPDLESVVLQIGSKTLKAASIGGGQDFVWPEDAMTVRLQARSKDTAPPVAEFSGPWAVTRFFAAADEYSSSGTRGSALFRLKNTASLGRTASTNSEVAIRITIDMKGAPLTLLPRDLQLGCVSAIAR